MGNAQNPQTLYIETFAGNGIAGFSGDGGRATSAELQWPSQIVLDRCWNVYFADNLNNRIRVINTQSTTQTLLNVSVCSGCIETVAGNGGLGFGGDGGPARDAMLAHPVGMGIDSAGNIYVADQQNHRRR
jgi:trimeric autotransporter adhesin